MKRSIQILALFSIVILSSSVTWAQFGNSAGPAAGPYQFFNDANGDGLCDICGEVCFKDADGDGQCDSCGAPNGNGPKGNGPGDGTGNDADGPKDGSGYGAGPTRGTGDCDGTGPSKDRANRASRRAARR